MLFRSLAAFMDDEDDDDGIVDESGYFSGEQPANSEEEEELAVDSEPTEVEPEEEIVEGQEQDFSPIAGYEMLMSTCWIDGILDPAEAKLLSRKRVELGITFEQHLEILRNILESSS